MPLSTAARSIVVPASRRRGSIPSAPGFAATPPAKPRSGHARASVPAAIDPPDTLEMRSRRSSQPASLSRQSDPAWKSIARYPPPDRHSAIPVSGSPAVTARHYRTSASTSHHRGRGRQMPGPLDERLVKAISHPIRHRVLVALNERVASPNELAQELGESLGRVSYHVRQLVGVGAIELVRTEPRRGAVEHYYRASTRAWFSAAEWARLPATTRRGILGENLK